VSVIYHKKHLLSTSQKFENVMFLMFEKGQWYLTCLLPLPPD
jgi:hypothetical protein